VEALTVPDESEGIATDGRRGGFHYRRRRAHRDGGIDRVAALAQDRKTDAGDERLARGNHAIHGKDWLVAPGPDEGVQVEVHVMVLL